MKALIAYIECCDQRRRDRATLKEYLLFNKFDIIDDPRNAECAFVFTCCVNNDMRIQSENLIKKLYLDNSKLKIIDMGCSTYQYPVGREDNSFIFSVPPKKHGLLEKVILDNLGIESRSRFIQVKFNGRRNPDDYNTWFISLGEGCSGQNCAYCIKYKSTGILGNVSLQNVENSFRLGIVNGCSNFRFIGEDVGAYEMENLNYPMLIQYLARIAIKEYRTKVHFNSFMNGINPYMLQKYKSDFYAMLKSRYLFYDGIQISVQTFNIELLNLCRRKGDPEVWIDIINEIKVISPYTEIWIQLIIGLPHQTFADIIKEVEIMSRLPVDVIHIYKYSHNKGSRFYIEDKFDQSESNRLFDFALEKLNITFGKERIKRSMEGSILIDVNRTKNPYNAYYHQYRAVE